MTRRLSPRESEVATLVGLCLTVKQIAAQLQISERAVNFHIRRIIEAWELDPNKDAATQIALHQTAA